MLRSRVGDRRHPAPRGRPAARGRRAVQRPRRRGGGRLRAPARRAGARAARRPLPRHARLLREAADHDGLEGHDQRPASRRLGRRQRGAAHGARAAARGALARARDGQRVPRPDHAAVHLGRGHMGGDRRAHDREPDPPQPRVGAVDAGRLQERHRGQRRDRGGRRPRRRVPTCFYGRHAGRDSRDPAHAGERGRARHPAGRARGAELRRGVDRATLETPCARRRCRSGS